MELLSFNETVKYLQINPSHLRSLNFKNKIPYVKIGRILKYNVDDLTLWLKKNSHGDIGIKDGVIPEKRHPGHLDQSSLLNPFENENIGIKKENQRLFSESQSLRMRLVTVENEKGSLSYKLGEAYREIAKHVKDKKEINKYKKYAEDLEIKYLFYRDQELRRLKKELE